MRKLRQCQDLARMHYDRDHSHDETGALGEDVPRWMEWWFRLFHEQGSHETPAGAARRERDERVNVAASLTGRQAPLGQRGNAPAELRHSTSRNAGAAAQRQANVGRFNVETIDTEGMGDDAFRSPAPRGRRNGTRRSNVSILSDGSSPLTDASSRFQGAAAAEVSMSNFTDALTSLISSRPSAQGQRGIIQIWREYNEVMVQRNEGGLSENDRNMFQMTLDGLQDEMREFVGARGRRGVGNEQGNTVD